ECDIIISTNWYLTKEVVSVKKLTAIFLSLVFIFSLVGCNKQDIKEQSNNILTLDKVVDLSAKGEKLTWSDFEQYESTETGSGLYILVYEIDENFDLWIGGNSMEESPFYIRLITKSNMNNFIDIRTDDVNEFIKSNKK
ncbi:MAG: hypothetical protein IJB45_04155, partial [Clostridia bacterium]|nr:hypothetical protein [Clostridia bacterium]